MFKVKDTSFKEFQEPSMSQLTINAQDNTETPGEPEASFMASIPEISADERAILRRHNQDQFQRI